MRKKKSEVFEKKKRGGEKKKAQPFSLHQFLARKNQELQKKKKKGKKAPVPWLSLVLPCNHWLSSTATKKKKIIDSLNLSNTTERNGKKKNGRSLDFHRPAEKKKREEKETISNFPKKCRKVVARSPGKRKRKKREGDGRYILVIMIPVYAVRMEGESPCRSSII